MERVPWLLGLVAAFGLGLVAGNLPRLAQVSTERAEELDGAERRASAPVGRSSRAGTTATASRPTVGYAGQRSSAAEGSGTADRASAGSVALLAQPGMRAPGTGSDDAVAPAPGSRPAGSPTATVESALQGFYRYLSEAGELGGRQRRERYQELRDELRALGPAGSEALMRVLAGSGTSDERRMAAQLLGELQDSRATPLLRDVLERDGDILLRRSAASALRRLGTPDTIPVLDALLANPSEDRYVRMSAASGLAQLGRPQGVTGLAQIFDDAYGDGRGRDAAFRALSSLNDDRALPFMRRVAASDAEPGYRVRAIRYLATHGDAQAVASLQQVAQSPYEQPSVRDAAAKALSTLGAR